MIMRRKAIDDVLKNKSYLISYSGFISAIIIVLLIPTYVWFIPPFMVIWGISWVLEAKELNENGLIKQYSYSIFMFSLFLSYCLWQLIGIIYSPDRSLGFQFFFSRLSLLLFPLVLVIPAEKIKDNIGKLLVMFAGSTAIYILFCFSIALYRSTFLLDGHLIFNPHPIEANWTSYFYGYYFSVNQHASYLSLYVILSIFIALEIFFEKGNRLRWRILWLITSIVLITSIYFLSSRTGIILLFLLIPFYILMRFRKKLKFLVAISIIIAVSAIGCFVILNNWKTKTILYSTIEGRFHETAEKDGRLVIWKAAMNPIRKNFFFGVGTGGVDLVMKDEYLKIGNQEFLKGKYNLHCQYLEVLLENGLVGLILFMSILCSMIYVAISRRNLLQGIFIISILVFFLFETGLNRLPGVSYFSLFSFLLVYAPDFNNQGKMFNTQIDR
jgi:O-antigen ligase